MADKKLNINIRIADLPPIGLRIEPENEAAARTAETVVNELWKTWSSQFGELDSKTILAMVAYEFAKRYRLLADEASETKALLEDFEKELDGIVLNVN